MARGQRQPEALTTVYASVAAPTGDPGRRWGWALLGAGWVVTVVLVGVVVWLLQGQGGSWETCLTNSSRENIPESRSSNRDCSNRDCSSLDRFQQELRKRLCEEGSPHSPGTQGCWLCPAGWQPFAAKCYQLSQNTGAWDVARNTCVAQGSHLVRLESPEEKDFIAGMVGNTSGAWIGLRITQPGGKTWTWWDGSPLQEALFPVEDPERGKSDGCAAVWKGRLNSHMCSSPRHWICEREATKI